MNPWKTVLRGGLATAGVVATMAGVHALRRAGASVLWPPVRDELRDEDFALIDKDRPGEVIADDGVCLATREWGTADAPVTVVFVHGFCNSMESFHFQRRHLAERWGSRVRLLMFDLRGHGRSGTPENDSCTVAQLGRDLLTVIDAKAARGPLILVGHSLGGMAVLAAASRGRKLFAERVRGVALLSTSAGEVTSAGILQLLRNPAVDGFQLAVRAAPALMQAGRVSARHVITPLLHVSSFHGQVSPTLSRFTTLMIDRTSIETIVKFVDTIELHDESAALDVLADVPVLVVGGARDLVIPFRNSRALHSAFRDCELLRVPGAAHMPHLQFPELIDDALDRLLLRTGVVSENEMLEGTGG